MPYLPQVPHDNTERFPALGHDFYTAIRLIEERWRFFPKIRYYNLLHDVTPVADQSIAAGEDGTTKVDDLYGEPIPVDVAAAWENPHSTAAPATADATITEIWRDPFDIHARVMREEKNLDLTKYGFDEFRDLMVVIPLSLFDKVGIRAREGDKILYDSDEYRVLRTNRRGFWKNTTVRMYMALMCERKRYGS